MSALLAVDDLTVRFRVKSGLRALLNRTGPSHIEAVSGVSLRLAAGETVALVGESGSGKTTLARSIIGLVPAADGSIRFEDAELRALSESAMKPYRRHISMMFQDPVGSLSPRLTVGALIAEPFRIHGLAGRDLRAEVHRLLRLVGLPAEFAERYPHQLSGGQARRVGVARALALEPRLVLADEPTAGLDVSVQGEILNLLNDLQQRLGLAILIITHNLNIVRHVADRLYIMYLGRFVEEGPTARVFGSPRHPYTKTLLSANPEPDPDAQIERLKATGEVPSLLRRPSGCEFHTRCPFAKERCREEMPKRVSEPDGSSFICHFPLAPAVRHAPA